MGLPHWFDKVSSDKKEPTRVASGKQEKRLVRLFSNSGATFGENDLKTPEFEVEAKTTSSKGYRVTAAEIKSIRDKCNSSKVPLQIIEFSEHKEEVVVLSLTDFMNLLKLEKI